MTPSETARLLIVEDDPTHLRALCDTLGDAGYTVVGCSDAKAALEALHEGAYDVMISDLAMPGMDGIALLRAALAHDPSMVAIIMTGEGTIGTAVAAMKSGAYDYLQKPFKLSAVLPVLQRGLEMRQLRLQNSALERQVRVHAAELEAANRELDAFTRSASHDLRSPLNAVLGYSTLMLRKIAPQLPPEQRKLIVNTEQAARRMDQLIGALMRLSHLGRQALELRPVDVEALVRHVVADLAADRPEREVDWRIGALPPAVADESLLRQVYYNLLANAWKFTLRTGAPVIEAGCLEDGAAPVYFVKDNGPGFDMARAERLFEAFHRLHRSDEFEGNGVGLSIVQRVVQRHGGRVWAESTPGAGATFYFTLRQA